MMTINFYKNESFPNGWFALNLDATEETRVLLRDMKKTAKAEALIQMGADEFEKAQTLIKFLRDIEEALEKDEKEMEGERNG